MAGLCFFVLLMFQDNVSEEVSFFLEFALPSSWIRRFKTHPDFRSPLGFSKLSQHQTLSRLLGFIQLYPGRGATQLKCQRRAGGGLGSDREGLVIRGPGESGLPTVRGRGQGPIAGPLTPLPAKCEHHHCPHLHHECCPPWASR